MFIIIKLVSFLVLDVAIPVEVPGLNQFIKEIPDGAVVLIEGWVDHPKAVLVKTLINTAMTQGSKLIYIAPVTKCGMMDQLNGWDMVEERCEERIDGNDHQVWVDHIRPKTVVLIDSLTALMVNKGVNVLLDTLESIRATAKRNGAIVIILSEEGLFPENMRTATGLRSDGIIQFLIRDSPDGVSRFIRIVKWMTGESYDRNIYYNYIEGKINVDLRYRVV